MEDCNHARSKEARMQKKPRPIARIVGGNIRAFRLNQGMTQGGLAERVGVETSTISRIERGVAAPSLDRLELIAKVLKVKTWDLVYDVSTVVAKDEGLSQMMRRLSAE